jgi:hypothetical protein
LTRDGEITVARIDLPLIEVHVPQGHGAHGSGFTGSQVHGFTGSQVHGFTGSRVHKFTGSRVHDSDTGEST